MSEKLLWRKAFVNIHIICRSTRSKTVLLVYNKIRFEIRVTRLIVINLVSNGQCTINTVAITIIWKTHVLQNTLRTKWAQSMSNLSNTWHVKNTTCPFWFYINSFNTRFFFVSENYEKMICLRSETFIFFHR